MAYLDSSPATPAPPEKGVEAKKPSARLAKYWREIEAYGKSSSDWHEQSEKIVKLYLDQHRTAASSRRFALLWSNIETLKPSIYAKLPVVMCSRRYKDPHPIGRTAAELLERSTNATFDLGRVDEVFRMVRDDRLLVARGQAWVRYEADLNGDKIKSERVCVDYVSWPDFGHNVTGVWKDVWLAWRKVYKNKDDTAKRFSAKVADQLTYGPRTDNDGRKETGDDVACIYELWDRKKRQTVFISRDYPEIIEEGAPPLDFRDFFPCPEPCYGSKTGKSLIPTPDYRYYQDQANEIDDLTEKIANLTDFLIMRGFIPAGPSTEGGEAVRILIQSLQSAMTSNKNVFVPVESWAGFTDKGGAAKLIDWLPVEKVMQALQAAVETRTQLIQDVYQITGISDILRGQTDAQETLGAQQLKAETGSRRISNAKDEVARFCRDVAQLVAEVIAEQFQPQTIADMTGYAYQPMMPATDPAQQGQQLPQVSSPPLAAQPPMQATPPVSGVQSPSGQTFNDEVIELLRDDRMRGFLIDIETDSTIQPDEDAEKQRRTEFVTAFGGFMKEAGEILPTAPSLAPMIGEILLFMVRGFRAGRGLEEVIERSMQQLGQQLQQPKPDPEQAKIQAEMAQKQAEMQMQQQQNAAELQFKQQELELKKQEMEQKLQMQQAQMQMDAQQAQQKMALEQQQAEADAQRENQRAANEMRLSEMDMQNQMQLSQAEAQQKAELAQRDHEQNAELNRTKTIEDIKLKSQQFAQKSQMDEQAFRADQNRADVGFRSDEKRKDEAHKARTENELRNQNESAEYERKARDADRGKPKKSIAKVLRDKDGKMTGAEISH
jgi:hypothetical protein